MDQKVGAAAKRHVVPERTAVPVVPSQLIVRQEDKGFLSLPEPKAEPPLGVVEWNRIDSCAVDFKGPLLQDFQVADSRFEVRKLDRKKPVPHFVVKRVSQAVYAGGIPVDMNTARGPVQRRKIGKTQHVIPVNVADQQVNVDALPFGSEFFSEGPDPGSRVNHHNPAAFERDLQAGGVSAVANRLLAGNCDGASGAPELYLHDRLSASGAMERSQASFE